MELASNGIKWIFENKYVLLSPWNGLINALILKPQYVRLNTRIGEDEFTCPLTVE